MSILLMFKLLFSSISFICLFFLSGYISRLGLKKGHKNVFLLPTAIEQIFGYCIYGFLILGSLVFFKNPNIGLVGANLIALFSFFKKFDKNSFFYQKLEPQFLIKILCVLSVFLVFCPMMFFKLGKYQFPTIYDLPKSLSVITALSHSKSWPIINPFFPDKVFAYNIFYFLPISSIVGYLQLGKYSFALYGALVLWTVWNMLGVIELILMKFKLSKNQLVYGLLLATFFSSLVPIFLETNYPIGFVARDGARYWIDDFFVIFIFIPQYVFACACIMASWYFLNESAHQRKEFYVIILCAAGLLTSFFYVIFISLWVITSLSYIYRKAETKSLSQLFFIPGLFFLLLTMPFLIQVKLWCGPTPVFTYPNFKAIQSLIWIAPFITLSIFGVFNLKNYNSHGLTYLMMLVLCLLNLLFVYDSDLGLKLLVLLKFLLILPAALGVKVIIDWCKDYRLFKFLFEAIFLYFCFLGIFLIESFILGSYRPMPGDISRILSELNNLEFNEKILVLDPNQEIAAFSQHLVFMDYRAYREDAYLPFFDRKMVIDFFNKFDYLQKTSLFTQILWKDNNAYHLYKSLDNFQKQHITKDLNWKKYQMSNSCELKFQQEHLDLSMKCLNDAGIIAPLNFEAGLYLLRTNVTGVVEEGSAHISIFGVKKIIDIPTGNYTDKTFFGYFYNESTLNNQNIALGFGGWTKGKGHLKFTNIQLIRLSDQKGDKFV